MARARRDRARPTLKSEVSSEKRERDDENGSSKRTGFGAVARSIP